MNRHSARGTERKPWWDISRRESGLLVLLILGLSTVLGFGGLAISGSQLLVPLSILFVVVLLFNILLTWLGRREVQEWIVVWASRLGNLALLTVTIYFTGGFYSPFLFLFIVYIVVASLRYGWRGAGQSFALCFASWIILLILSPPTDSRAWGWAATMIGAFGLFTVPVGILAERHLASRQEALQRNRELAFLRGAGQVMGASLDPQEVLAETLAQVNEVLDVEAASLALVDQKTGRITFELAIGGGNESVKGLRMEPGEGIVGQVIQEDRPLLVADVSDHPQWYAGVDEVSGYQTHSLLCVPLHTKGQVIGALELVNKRDGPFTEYDLRLLSALAELSAQCIENARLHEQIQRHAQRVEEAYDEVRKLDELKSAFIRNVSHELRTPLALIGGYVELVLDGQLGPLQPEQRQSLSLVAEKSSHLTRMVNDIISLQTIGVMGFDMQSLCLVTLIQSAVNDALPKAEKARIELKLVSPDAGDLPSVRGDPQRLGQVFEHLLDNAIKFSPNGGTVQVDLEQTIDMICVQIQDEGIGLPADQLERVFDRFYQIDGSSTRRYGGTGLGLALVKEIVEAHGGAVWVDSQVGEGSTFAVYLPVFKEHPAD